MDIIADFFFSLIGRISLYLKYRNRNKVRTVLQNEYNNSFSSAGARFCGQSVAGILLIAFVLLLIATVWGFFRHNI